MSGHEHTGVIDNHIFVRALASQGGEIALCCTLTIQPVQTFALCLHNFAAAIHIPVVASPTEQGQYNMDLPGCQRVLPSWIGKRIPFYFLAEKLPSYLHHFHDQKTMDETGSFVQSISNSLERRGLYDRFKREADEGAELAGKYF